MTNVSELMAVAPAKINWTLEVLGRSADGYHELRSVIQTISMVDYVYARPSERLSLDVDGRRARALQTEDNLILRAARALPGHKDKPSVAFRLTKHIPEAAGLGGGSSDAAAALRLLCRLWNLDDVPLVYQAAASLGSDVPFFLRGGLQLAGGRGEDLAPFSFPSPLPPNQTTYLVLLMPPISIPNKTALLFAQLRPAHYSDGEATASLASRCRAGHVPTPADYINVFDRVADAVFPDLPRYRRMIEEATGGRAMLAGAGPTLFAACAGWAAALQARQRLFVQGVDAWAELTTNLISDPCGL